MGVDRCVACGAEVEEGRQVCQTCAAKVREAERVFRDTSLEIALGKISEAEKLLKSARATLTLIKGGKS